MFSSFRNRILNPQQAGAFSTAWPRLFTIVILNCLAINLVLGIVTLGLYRAGVLKQETSNSLSTAALYLFKGHQGDDSWRPMLEALHAHDAGLGVYDTVLFRNRTKFQYPLTSLVPLKALQSLGLNDAAMFRVLNAITWVGFWVTIIIVGMILKESLFRSAQGDDPPTSSRAKWTMGAAVVLCGIFYFPMTKAYALGQAQVLINMLFALTFYLWMREKYTATGIMVGLMTLIKPQYGLFLLWFALRKKFTALAAGSIILGIGVCLAALVFGWREQLQYIDVLTFIGRRGETFWVNDSVNGLFNRFFFPDLSLRWQWYAPYHPVVYMATLISTGLMVLAALFYPMISRTQSGTLDFSIMAITATAASPIAWVHHYGVLLPIFAYLVAVIPPNRNLRWLAVAYIVTSNSWSLFNALQNVPVANVLLSVRFFGVLLLLGLLYKYSRSERQPVERAAESETALAEVRQELVPVA